MTEAFFTARDLMVRYRICRVSLRRWLRDPALHFPQPTVIRRRFRWQREAIEEFERDRSSSRGSAGASNA